LCAFYAGLVRTAFQCMMLKVTAKKVSFIDKKNIINHEYQKL